MFRILLSALLGLSIVGPLAAQPPKSKDPPKKDAPKDKAPPKNKDAAKESPAAKKEVAGMFKTKDLTKKTLTITVDGKDRTFKITDDTKILGPRGGDRELKDEVLDKGYKITVVVNAKDDGIADEVKLPFANEREGSGKDKAKEKTKDKDAPKSKDKP